MKFIRVTGLCRLLVLLGYGIEQGHEILACLGCEAFGYEMFGLLGK